MRHEFATAPLRQGGVLGGVGGLIVLLRHWGLLRGGGWGSKRWRHRVPYTHRFPPPVVRMMSSTRPSSVTFWDTKYLCTTSYKLFISNSTSTRQKEVLCILPPFLQGSVDPPLGRTLQGVDQACAHVPMRLVSDCMMQEPRQVRGPYTL